MTEAFKHAADIEAATPINSSTSPTPGELPTWARDEAYRLVCENSWGWEESASDELTSDQEQHVEWLASELVKIVAERLPLTDAGEVEGRDYRAWQDAEKALEASQAEVERLRTENAALLKQWNDLDNRTERQHREWNEKLTASQSSLAAAERERDEWKRQHDRVLSQAQKDFDRAAMADTYEQWLLDLGQISGCGHVDERLPRCIEEAFAKECERAAAASTKSQRGRDDNSAIRRR